jgi:hypothetical protein
MINNAHITSYAILEVDLTEGSDFIDLLSPLVMEALARLGEGTGSAWGIAESLRDRFGVDAPVHVVERVLKRLVRSDTVSTNSNQYTIGGDYDSANFTRLENEFLRQHQALLESLITFAHERFSVVLDQNQAAEALEDYLSAFDIDVLHSIVGGGSYDVEDDGSEYSAIIGAFIRNAVAARPEDFKYLEAIVKGHLLANVLYFPDPDVPRRRFKGTSIYLDAPFLVTLLGLAEDEEIKAARDLMRLFFRAGVKLACFHHSVGETRAILSRFLTSGRGRQESARRLAKAGLTLGSLTRLVDRLEKELESWKIEIKVKRPVTERTNLDEAGLLEQLKGLRYTDTSGIAVRNDVDSLASVYRLRRGHLSAHVEDCGTLFVTDNEAIVGIANQFFSDSIPHNYVSVAMSTTAAINLMWLKYPMGSPDLPRHLLLAHAAVAIVPSERTWGLYEQAIERVRKDDTITEDDYYLLRYTAEAREELSIRTIHSYWTEEEVLGLVPEILESAHERIAAGWKREIESTKAEDAAAHQETIEERDDLLSSNRLIVNQLDATQRGSARLQAAYDELADREDAWSARNRALAQRARSLATWISHILFWMLVVLVSAVAAVTWLSGNSEWFNSQIARWVTTAASVLWFTFSVVSVIKREWLDGARSSAEAHIEKWLGRLIGVAE